MKTIGQIKVCDGGTAEVSYSWMAHPDSNSLSMHIEAIGCDADTRLTWEDQFALLDTVWLALVDVRRMARNHGRNRRTLSHSPGEAYRAS